MVLSSAEQEQLADWSRKRRFGRAVTMWARIVHACAAGLDNVNVARRLRVSDHTVSKWRARYLARGIDRLRDQPRSGRPAFIDRNELALVVRTLQKHPWPRPRWTIKTVAEATGLTCGAVFREWKSRGIHPRRSLAQATVEGVVANRKLTHRAGLQLIRKFPRNLSVCPPRAPVLFMVHS